MSTLTSFVRRYPLVLFLAPFSAGLFAGAELS